jgi:dTDP-4-dehydrorhamnose reductase
MTIMRIVLTGASGQLGVYLQQRLARSRHDVIAWSHLVRGDWSGVTFVPVDLMDEAATLSALESANPDAVLHAAAISSAAEVARDPETARAVNFHGTQRIADWCRSRRRRLVYTSTDMVFDGSKAWNGEDDLPAPIIEYGRTKHAAEGAVLTVERGLVARIALLFGPSRSGKESYFDQAVAALQRGESRAFFDDEFRTPLHYQIAADALVLLLDSGYSGCIHIGGTERVSRFELMRRVAQSIGIDPNLVRSNQRRDVPGVEQRPADLSLDTSLLSQTLPGLARPAIEDCARWREE